MTTDNAKGTARNTADGPNNSPQAMTESRLTTGGRDVASYWITGVIKLPSKKCTATYIAIMATA